MPRTDLKAISQQEHKRIMLEMMIEFADFCDKNNLTYYLDAGTLIGAVRHKGFIPWDDDVDLNMPQPDYDRLCELVKPTGGYINDHIAVDFPDNTLYPYLKITDKRTLLIEFPDTNPMKVNVYMDLFPKYGIAKRSVSAKMLCKISELLGLIHWVNKYSVDAWQRPSQNLFKKAAAKIIKALTINPSWAANVQNRLMHAYARRHPLETCEFVTTLTNGEYHKLAPRNCFEGYTLLEFEGHMFKAPADFDTYLRCLYPGDYMQLPPENKRIHHNIEVYWK